MLGQALDSLFAQTEPSFEAIVVDDGSHDGTAEVARRYAMRDERVTLLRTDARGVSAARNTAIAEARGEWLLFLDADDSLEPRALELLLAEARSPRRPDVVACGWARVGPDGRSFSEHRWGEDEDEDAFTVFAYTCAVAIHSCLVRRDLVVRVGGFDESLVTCEDWDLWQRIARTGASFAGLDECLAPYSVRPGTASSRGRQLLVDALKVIGRGHSPDPRVADPDPRYVLGRDRELLAGTRLACACYAAGLVIGAGGDPRALLDELGDDADPDLDPETVASCVMEAIALPRCVAPEQLAGAWPEFEASVELFLTEIEKRSVPGLARRARLRLERLLLERWEGELPLTVGSTHARRIDLETPIPEVRVGGRVERLLCSAELQGGELGRLELPVCDGLVPARVLADAVAAEVFWPLLGVYLARGDTEAHADSGWEAFLGELWARPGWPDERFYDPTVPDAASGRAVVAPANWLTLEVSDPLPDVVARRGVLRVEVTVGGAPAGVVEVPVGRGKVPAQRIRVAITTQCGLELALTAVREALIGRSLPLGRPLRGLLREAAARQQPLIQEDDLLVPRWPGPLRSAVSRRAALPLEAAVELLAAAPDALALRAETARVVYEPAVQPRWPHALPRPVGGGAPIAAGSTALLPILMYHRVADRGPRSLRRYRLSPAAFDEQLAALREWGYRGVLPDEWRRACEARRPLPGKAVMLTFDDGYRDFAEDAWPLLERHGFPVTVFVVTDAAGATSRWDARHGQPADLLRWDEIEELRGRGVRFGSHTASHRCLTGLSNADAVRELVRSRTSLEERLGTAVSSIAYPYGDVDGGVTHLAGACGYSVGFTCEARHSELIDSPLLMPRFEVRSEFSMGDFARTLALE